MVLGCIMSPCAINAHYREEHGLTCTAPAAALLSQRHSCLEGHEACQRGTWDGQNSQKRSAKHVMVVGPVQVAPVVTLDVVRHVVRNGSEEDRSGQHAAT